MYSHEPLCTWSKNCTQPFCTFAHSGSIRAKTANLLSNPFSTKNSTLNIPCKVKISSKIKNILFLVWK